MEIRARDVRVGDKIARRNSCGGLIGYHTVTEPLWTPAYRRDQDGWGAIAVGPGSTYIVGSVDEDVEIALGDAYRISREDGGTERVWAPTAEPDPRLEALCELGRLERVAVIDGQMTYRAVPSC